MPIYVVPRSYPRCWGRRRGWILKNINVFCHDTIARRAKWNTIRIRLPLRGRTLAVKFRIKNLRRHVRIFVQHNISLFRDFKRGEVYATGRRKKGKGDFKARPYRFGLSLMKFWSHQIIAEGIMLKNLFCQRFGPKKGELRLALRTVFKHKLLNQVLIAEGFCFLHLCLNLTKWRRYYNFLGLYETRCRKHVRVAILHSNNIDVEGSIDAGETALM